MQLSSLVGKKVNIKQLRTTDGFLVPNHYLVSIILRDNDILNAIDLETFMEQEYKFVFFVSFN